MGREVFEHVLNAETLNPGKVQQDLLFKLLDDNKDTEYGGKYGFSDIHSIEEFRKKVPVITYEDVADELERMKNGEKNILTAYEFNHMNTTAGTIGKPKTIPMTGEQQKIFEKYNYHYLNGLLDTYCDPDYLYGRTFTPIGGKYVKTESGITLGCASTKAAEYIGGMEKLDAQMSLMYTSPSEVMFADDDTDTKYIHMRFAMADRDMTGINIGFFSYLVQLFHYIETNYEVLINDIEKGCISDTVKIDDATREKLMKKISPMPERAAELREIFKNGPDLRFVPLIWPNLRYIMGVGGDGFAIYDSVIRNKYAGNDIVYFYSGINASEGLWSVPRGKENTDGILAAGSAFMEFLPEEANGDLSQIKSIDELEVGKVYELIITDFCGLYRYRVFDCVKVTGFVNKTPCVDYMYRANRTINIGGEKMTEAAIKAAVSALVKEYDLPLVDYNVYADKEQMPGQYQFLFEFDASGEEIDVEALREPLYRQLCNANEIMKLCYEKCYIALPAIFALQPETNMLYRELMVYRGASAAQLKPVRIIANEDQKKFFFKMRK